MTLPAQEGVSIIVPAYNYAEFIEQALESALAQTYPNIEIVVVDDGSTDQTPVILRRYADRIRIVTQDNLGLAAARNTGLREASHGLVAFLDADDVLLPGMVSLLHGTLALVGGECALVAANHSYIDASGRPLDKYPRGPQETVEVTRKDLLLRNRFATCGVLARRDALVALGGFNEELARVEDRDLWLRLVERRQILQVPDVLCQVRLHFRNMSKDAELMASCLHDMLTAAFQRRPADPTWERRCWGAYHHECAWMYHDAEDRWRAVASELRSLTTFPAPSLRADLAAPPWFRIRSLLRFLLGLRATPAPLPDE